VTPGGNFLRDHQFFLTNNFELDNFVPNFGIKVQTVGLSPGGNEDEQVFEK
jgi:hypothetical protein